MEKEMSLLIPVFLPAESVSLDRKTWLATVHAVTKGSDMTEQLTLPPAFFPPKTEL